MDSSLSEVAHRALSLPVSDRIVLAQTLWDSLDEQDVASMAGDVD